MLNLPQLKATPKESDGHLTENKWDMMQHMGIKLQSRWVSCVLIPKVSNALTEQSVAHRISEVSSKKQRINLDHLTSMASHSGLSLQYVDV